MPTEQQLVDALTKADAAGDHASAQQFAGMIKQMRQNPPAPPTPQEPNTAVDVARSIPGGLAKGAASVLGLPGDVGSLIDRGTEYVAGKISPAYQSYLVKQHAQQNALPTSSQLADILSKPTGGYYQPKTTAGNYAETIASFAPAAVGGEASLGMRAARVLVPGVLSETGGQLTKGTAAEPYARAGGALLGGGVTAAAPGVGRFGARVLNKAADQAGVPFLDPANEAQARMSSAIQRDGGLQPIIKSIAQHNQVGASQPALVDVGGNNVKRLVRAASASEGLGQNLALGYGDTVRADYQDNLIRHTQGLTPGETRPAGAFAADLKQTQSDLATEQYKQPYSQPAAVTKDMVSALQGPEGRSAIGRAYAAARANRDAQAMSELSDLRGVAAEQGGGADPITGRKRTLDQALANLSAGSLDRVRIAMRETGRSLSAKGANDMARGYFGRVGSIDTALDQTPGLAEARGTYRRLQAHQNAVEVGQKAYTTPSDSYSAQLADLSTKSTGAISSAGIGHRQALIDAIERGPQGATGAAGRIGSTQQTKNLESSFGAPAAQKYQTAVGLETARLRNANMISPNTGSQTALRSAEENLVNSIPVSKHGLLVAAINWVKSGVTLTPAQRAEIVKLGISPVQLSAIAKKIPPRALNALRTGTYAQIGAQQSGQQQ